MSLYRDDVLDHYHHPQHFGKPEQYTHASEQLNQTCGDRQSVYLTIENDKIKDIRFEGVGCAISIASTSMLTERIIGTSVNDLRKMDERDIVALIGSVITPSRMNCAMLGLRSFQAALSNEAIVHTQITKPIDTPIVTKNSNLGEIAEKYPQAARVFTEYGLHCVGCFASAFDTVEAGASIHGMSTEEIEDMIKRANEEIALHPEECLNHESGVMNHAESS